MNVSRVANRIEQKLNQASEFYKLQSQEAMSNLNNIHAAEQKSEKELLREELINKYVVSRSHEYSMNPKKEKERLEKERKEQET